MRVLFTTLPLSGHFDPLVPIARAARNAGHEVAVACPPPFVPQVTQAGFRAIPRGYDNRGEPFPVLFPGANRYPIEERAPWVVANVFIGVYGAALAPDLLALCREWLPDVIVRESAEFAGCVAAEAVGVPHASVRTELNTATYSLRGLFTAALAPLRERAGLESDPDNAMAFRYLHFACEPPDFTVPGEARAPTSQLLRPASPEAGDQPPPAWLAGLPDRPTIYATLGTVFSAFAVGREVMAMILEALGGEPYNLIVTVGRATDPAQYGPQPEHVHIARYIPQGVLLPYCDLVVHQGGFSTITGVLHAGKPMVVVPIGADQPQNAACCVAQGVGVIVATHERTPETIRAAVREVLHNPVYRRNAQRVRDGMLSLPGPEKAVALLERLAVEKQPLITAPDEETRI